MSVSSPRRANIPACIFGWSVLTLPPIISLCPVYSETSITLLVIFLIALYVPPVEIISTFLSKRNDTKRSKLVLSERLINADFGKIFFIL